MFRSVVIFFHRYIGLLMAGFLILAGLTGSILVWEEELDSAINRDWMWNQSPESLPAHQILETVQAQYPESNLGFTLFPPDPKRSAIIYVSNWPSPEGENIVQIFVDRSTGEVLGGRDTFSPNFFDRREVIPWIYRFHYSLTAGQWGTLILGIISLIWLLDSLIAWYLTLPKGRLVWRKWKKSWLIKKKRLNFDLHRASGLWLLSVFIVLAFTSVYFNLHSQVFMPALEAVTDVTEQPYEQLPLDEPINEPSVSYQEAAFVAREEMYRRAFTPSGLAYLSYNARLGYYLFGWYGEERLARDRPGIQIYVGHDGSLKHVREEGRGTTGDFIVELQFPLHSGQIFGLPGRLIIFFAGITLVVLSITGVVIWWRKLRARLSSQSSESIKSNSSAEQSKPKELVGTLELS